MDDFLTDEQQADRARNWLRSNGVFIAAGIVLGLGGLFGWQQWKDYQARVSGEASVIWEEMRSAIKGERFSEVSESLALLEKDYKRTPYLDQARLMLAQMHMDRNAPDEALAQLKLLKEAGRDPQLRKVAGMRMAQLLAYQGQFDEALTALGSADDTPFAGLYHDLRGDILFAKGQLEDAAAEYALAIEKDTIDSIDHNFVQIKLDDVKGSIPVAAAENPVSPPADSAEPSAAAKE